MSLNARETSKGGPAAAPSAISCPSAAAPAAPPQGASARGIAYLLGALALFTLMDATAKFLGTRYHPFEIVWVRFALNFLILLAIFRARVPGLLRSRQPGLQLARTLAQVATVTLFFAAVSRLGLAEVTALFDINPVLISLGAALFLGERLGPRRLAGIGAAFVGALIILRPGVAAFDPVALLALAGAVTYAAGALLTRVLRDEPIGTSLLWSALVGVLASSLALPFVWTPPALADLWLFAALGGLGSLGQLLLLRAFAETEAGALAPFGYFGLIFASLWGALIFGQLPDVATCLGALVIVGAGVYVWARERRAARPAPAPDPFEP